MTDLTTEQLDEIERRAKRNGSVCCDDVFTLIAMARGKAEAEAERDQARRALRSSEEQQEVFQNYAADLSIKHQAETARLREQEALLREALEPFAVFADPRGIVMAGKVITAGSPMARRQITMGDCYRACTALAATSAEPREDGR